MNVAVLEPQLATYAFAVPCVTCGLDYPDTPAHACPRCQTPCHQSVE